MFPIILTETIIHLTLNRLYIQYECKPVCEPHDYAVNFSLQILAEEWAGCAFIGLAFSHKSELSKVKPDLYCLPMFPKALHQPAWQFCKAQPHTVQPPGRILTLSISLHGQLSCLQSHLALLAWCKVPAVQLRTRALPVLILMSGNALLEQFQLFSQLIAKALHTKPFHKIKPLSMIKAANESILTSTRNSSYSQQSRTGNHYGSVC